MSKEDIYSEEVARRRKAIDDITGGLSDINAALEQFNDLDETYKVQQENFKTRLENIYKETRHYNGKWPIVYTNTQVEKYPFFSGDVDNDCNPYYRITKVIAGEDEGISPLFSETTRTGGANINRDRNYQNENSLRTAALNALQAYPDTSLEGENATSGYCTDEIPSGSGTTEALCIANDGTWNKVYGPGTTAPEKINSALTAWKASLVELKTDLCTSELADESNVVFDLLQDVIDSIDYIITNLPGIPTYPAITPAPGPMLSAAISTTINYIQNDIPNNLDPRKTQLNSKSTLIEKKHFAIIGLRLHQINGSFTKVKQLKDQKKTNLGLIENHKKSIADINILRISDS